MLVEEEQGCRCKGNKDGNKDVVVGVQFETRDVDLFIGQFEAARMAVERLGEESTACAEAMERLSRANRSARTVLHPWWTSGPACLATGGWIATGVCLALLVAGVGITPWLVAGGLLSLAIALLSTGVASHHSKEPS